MSLTNYLQSGNIKNSVLEKKILKDLHENLLCSNCIWPLFKKIM